MKTKTYTINPTPFIILLALIFPLFGMAQSKSEFNKSKEIIPDQPAGSKVMGNKRLEDGTGIARAIYKPGFSAGQDTPEKMAEQYLAANPLPLMLKSDINDLEHKRTIETPGGFKVQFIQKAAGYPVYGSTIRVSINRDNKVVFVTNSYKPIGDLETDITISSEDALLISRNHIGILGNVRFEKVELVVFPLNNFNSVVAYQVNLIPSEDHFGDWELLVDAGTGIILRAEDKACYFHPVGDGVKENGSGWVFDPDPITNAKTIYGAPQFVDNNDADSDSLTAQLKTVTLNNISFDGNMYRLEGPYAAIDDHESPYTGYYEQESSDFYFTRSNEAFEAVNAYFHLDKSMAYLHEELGFDVMPFQYAGGVRFDPHGLNGENNAHYTGDGKIAFGSHPNRVDSGEDPAIILHELGHGIHDWITNSGLSQVDGLSEGLSDYWAQSYTRSLGVFEPGDEAYDYFGLWGLHPLSNNSLRVTNFEGHYPEDMNGEVHYDGQLWSSSLMSIYDLIGREATDMNCWEGIAMLNSNSSQVDAAYAFSQADQDLYGGDHLDQIFNVFYERGYFPGPVIPNFIAGEPNGEGPRDVVFTDESVAFLNDIVSWEWDFNNDGVIDSYDQNPTHTFTEVGGYTISLTISDGENSKTLRKENYITVNGGFFVYETSRNEQDHSGAFIRDFLEERGYDVIYSNYYPTSLIGFDAAFLSFGNADEDLDQGTYLEYTRSIPIQNYLEAGGTLYTDGSPFLPVPAYFSYPNGNVFAGLFGVASLIPTLAANPISKLSGPDGSFCEGMVFNGSNQQSNWYIDKVTPAEGAYIAFEEEGYGNVSIYNEGEYGQKTFHLGYSLADLVDEDPHSSRLNILINVLDYFGYPEDEGFVVANFDVDETEVLPGDEIVFTDFSISDDSYEVTSWAWDFNEDGVIDSEEQNPVWSYSSGGFFDVMLVVSNGQTTDTLVKEDLILVRAGIFVFEGEENGVDQSGTFIRDYLEDLGKEVVYSNHFPYSLIGFDAVFLSFGSGYFSGTHLDDLTTNTIKVYILLQGGNVYLEGSKAFGKDQAGNTIWGMFGLENVENGGANVLDLLEGQAGSIMNGMTFSASSQFDMNSIDLFTPDPEAATAKTAFEENGYGSVAVQFDGADGYGQKTFCMSYSLAQLEDGDYPNTRNELLYRVLYFFDPTIGVEMNPGPARDLVKVYPNPASDHLTLVMAPSTISALNIEIFDLRGQSVMKRTVQQEDHIKLDVGHLSTGTYFYKVLSGDLMQAGKLIIAR